MKENQHFRQSRLNYVTTKNKKQKKIRLVTSIAIGVVAKTNDEICFKY